MEEEKVEAFLKNYYRIARKAKDENRVIMNHVCVRVENIDKAEELLCESFGVEEFIRPGGLTFQGEKELSVAWINDETYLELCQHKKPQEIGYDTGVGHPIGHLSEIGFFVPDMTKELERLGKLGWELKDELNDIGVRMVKIDQKEPSGFPVELIELKDED